jgi:hypothetical protein
MKKFIFSLLFASIGFSALPPVYQTSNEIKEILNDERLYEKLGSESVIQGIIKGEKGWIVITNKYYLRVFVEYLPAKRVGPVDFRLHFSDPIELEMNYR